MRGRKGDGYLPGTSPHVCHSEVGSLSRDVGMNIIAEGLGPKMMHQIDTVLIKVLCQRYLRVRHDNTEQH